MSKNLVKPLLAAWMVLTGSCALDEPSSGLGGPVMPMGPTCDNLAVSPCQDCDPANPEHLACYDAFTLDVLPVFNKYCIGCHSNGGIGEFNTGGFDAGLSLEADVAYLRLLMPSFGDGGITRRVVPGRPDSSALYNKLVANADGVWFGTPMPQGISLVNMDPAGVEAIRKWILRGAKPPLKTAIGKSEEVAANKVREFNHGENRTAKNFLR